MIFKSIKTNLNRSITSSFMYKFSQIQSRSTYPYQFGGIHSSFQNNIHAQGLLQMLFPSDTIQGFKQAYRFALYALQQKSKKSLQSVFQQNLVKNISFRDVNLVNQQDDIEVRCGKLMKIFGSKFVRSPTQELKLTESKQQNLSFIDMGFLNPTLMMSAGPSVINNGIPVLLSKLKLVQNEGNTNKDKLQIHQMQFQIQGKIDIAKYFKLAMQFSKQQKFSSPQQARNMLKDVIGKNYEWKVGDFDKVLNGNLIIKQ